MRNEGNIGHIVRNKRAVTSLYRLGTKYLPPANSSYIKGSKKMQKISVINS